MNSEHDTVENWADIEIKTVNFKDKRLKQRCSRLLEIFINMPNKSIPSACKAWSDTKAAYRFCDNVKVSETQILHAHSNATIERIKQENVILFPQDTTEIDLTSKKHTENLGHIGQHEKRKGFYLHPTLAITPDRVCLGVVHTKMWARETFGVKTTRKTRKIEDKESIRWLESFQAVKEVSKQAPNTLCVNIADREGDIYEFFLETNTIAEDSNNNIHWLIRSAQDRLTTEHSKLWESVEKTTSLGTIEFNMPAGRGRKARMVKQEVYATEITLKAPKRIGQKLANIKVHAVLTKEIDAPDGVEPVEWLLLTSLPITTHEEAIRIVEWYLCRWQIEIYFKIIKSGCGIEEIQLKSFDRLKICLAVYMIVSWRILFTTMLGRKCPDLPCNILFEDSEWKSVYVIIKKQQPPETPPTLNQMIRLIACLGGFLNRKNDGFPGVKTIWIGMQRMKDFALAWEVFNSSSLKTCG